MDLESKAKQLSQIAIAAEAIKHTATESSHAVYDMVIDAGARDIQQGYCLRSECSGAFADALNSIDFNVGGSLSPKLLVSLSSPAGHTSCPAMCALCGALIGGSIYLVFLLSPGMYHNMLHFPDWPDPRQFGCLYSGNPFMLVNRRRESPIQGQTSLHLHGCCALCCQIFKTPCT